MLKDTLKINQAVEDTSKYDLLINSFNEIKKELKIEKSIECKVFLNVCEAISWLTNGKEPAIDAYEDSNKTSVNTNVLITGSLYLVGLSLKVLEQKIA